MRVNNGHLVLKMQGFLISKRKKKLYYCSHAIILDSKARRFGDFLNYLVWVPAEAVFVFRLKCIKFWIF